MIAQPSAAVFLSFLRQQGFTHVIGLPDNMSAPLFAGIEAAGLAYIKVTREGEAFAIASGLWIGGAVPLVAIQNTGLLESGDALRGTVTRLNIPMLVLVTWRGHATLAAPLEPDLALTRPDVDSTAVLTQPTLEAWRIPWSTLVGDEETRTAMAAWTDACDRNSPHVLLVPRGFRA